VKPVTTMMALRAHARGGPEQLIYEPAPVPAPGSGEALIAVHAGGITFAPSYRQPASRGDTIDAAFRLDEGRIPEGTLGWAARAGHGTTTGRDTPLVLADRYTCRWRDYSRVPLTTAGPLSSATCC
jgi:hypothetical protein